MQIRNVLLAGLAAIAVAASTGAMAQNISVVVNGQPISFPNQQPVMQDDRVFVPLRGVFENLGARVEWDPATQTVTGYRGHTKVQLTIGQTTASVDGNPVQLDVPAQILNGSTMVPLRFVGEALGNHVRWDSSNNAVIISGEHDDYHPDHGPVPPPPPPPPYGGPIFVPAPEFSGPVVLERNAAIPISFGINFGWGHLQIGSPIECPLPPRPGFPHNTRVQGTVTNITTINNVNHYTIVYNNIVTPSGQKIPFQGHASAAVPRGGHPGAPVRVTMNVDKQIHIAPKAPPPARGPAMHGGPVHSGPAHNNPPHGAPRMTRKPTPAHTPRKPEDHKPDDHKPDNQGH